MSKVKIDLSQIKSRGGKPTESLNWANIPPEEGFIVLTHGEVREDIPDNVAKNLIDIGYAIIIQTDKVAVPVADKEVKSKSTKKRLSRSNKK